MGLCIPPKDGDWTGVRKAFRQVSRALEKYNFYSLTASQLLGTNSNAQPVSISDLTAYIAGTANQVIVTDDADGTLTLSLPQDLNVGDHPTFDYINLSTSQGVTGLTTTDHPTFDYITLSTSQGVTGLTTTDHPTFDYINLSTTQGVTGLATSDSPTFNSLTLTSTANIRQLNPDNDNTYDIGEAGRSWKDFYILGNIVLGTSTGTQIGTATTQKVGFWGTAPVVQPSAYTPSNVSTDRSYDADATTTDELADVLGTLIADLQNIGLIG